ncbi:transposase [Duganella phyllosphaerae]|uniref:Flagellar assembly protein H n=1 Tax=Duganella phyllosphaerae TaxID=762836 RepID=A0A1E7X5J2_9BURK|nr:transposase [Duganella phyllosphaerae]OFA07806.1 flagellar assembly protein H [Duganella phyllosphaerae]
MSDDYDSPWKEVVIHHFPEFMAFYFPQAHAQIDWSLPHVFLDQELAALSRDAELGKRLLDKLVSVHKLDGDEQWVLVQLEVQGWRDADFAERMFVYNYRVYDRYRHPVASMALLTDDNRYWRPTGFGWRQLGCTMQLDFPIAKMHDYAYVIADLANQDNPFALVSAAHLLAQNTRNDAHRRRIAKWRLTKMLYERDWDRQRIIDLYRVMDWIMRLPPALEQRLRTGIVQFERRSDMTYLSSIERIGMEIGEREGLKRGLDEGRKRGLDEGRKQGIDEGLQQGQRRGAADMLALVLKARFGPLDPSAQSRIDAADTRQITRWAENSVHADSLDAVFRSE